MQCVLLPDRLTGSICVLLQIGGLSAVFAFESILVELIGLVRLQSTTVGRVQLF